MADPEVIALPEISVTGADPGTSQQAPGTTPPVTPPAGPTPPSDDLTLTVDGRIWGGWDAVRLTRGCEQMPSAFNISMTERFPGELSDLVVKPGQTCIVKMGADLVLTGYIDRYAPVLDAKRHTVTVWGRSRAQDLVDCSAIFDTFQISGQTVGQIATTLAGKYGIKVSAPDGEGPVVPQLGLQLGETTWDVVERLARFAKFLAYDDPEGNLVLRPVSTEKHASGVQEGVNMLAGQAEFSMDQRYSEYQVFPSSVLPLMQAEQSAGGGSLPYPIGTATDQEVKRLRKLIVILEHSGGTTLSEAAKARAEWEAARRRGRSEMITVTVDNWRDSAGKLWEPNRLMNVSSPTCQVHDQTWIIGSVTYLRGEEGTVARLTLMPPKAFAPQYDPLVAFNWQAEQSAAEELNNRNPKLGEGAGP